MKNILFAALVLLIVGCASTEKIDKPKIEKPNTDLFKTLEDLVRQNGYLILSYTSGNIIENYTYDLQMESTKSFNMWSWTGTSEELNCTVTVNADNDIVAQIYSTAKSNKAKLMANGFHGKKNSVVIFLTKPSTGVLVNAYNKMMNGIDE